MEYCGAPTIADLQRTARFVRITGTRLRKSTHDISITKEAPNYGSFPGRHRPEPAAGFGPSGVGVVEVAPAQGAGDGTEELAEQVGSGAPDGVPDQLQ